MSRGLSCGARDISSKVKKISNSGRRKIVFVVNVSGPLASSHYHPTDFSEVNQSGLVTLEVWS